MLILLMGVLIGESLFHPVESLWHQFLRQNHLHMQLIPHSFQRWSAKDITYCNKPLAKEVDLQLQLSSLLHAKLTITDLLIKKLQLNTLQSMRHTGGSGGFFLPFIIKKARIEAVYCYKEPFFIKLELKKASLHEGIINNLSIQSPIIMLHSRGKYKKRQLNLAGKITKVALPKDITIKEPIDFRASVNTKKVIFKLIKIKAIYQNIEAKDITIDGTYDYHRLHATYIASLLYPYGKALAKGAISYQDKVFLTLHADMTNKPFLPYIRYDAYKNIAVDANGPIDKLTLHLTNPRWSATASIDDQKIFHLSTSPIDLTQVVQNYPKNLPKIVATLETSGSMKEGIFKIESNYAAIDGKWRDKNIDASLQFLKNYRSIHLMALSPTQISIDIKHKKAQITNTLMQAKITAWKKAHVLLPKTTLIIEKKEGILEGKFTTNSLKKLTETLSQLYPLSLPIDTRIDANFSYNLKTKSYQTTLTIPKQPGLGWKSIVDYFTISLHGQDSEAIIDYYALVLKSHGFYATKPSYIQWRDDKLFIKKLWIDDAITIQGEYTISKQKGRLSIEAPSYHYASIEGDLTLTLRLQASIDNDRIDVEGSVTPLGGVITYQPQKSRTIKDRDIIVIDEPGSAHSKLYGNLSLAIQIESHKPLLYKIPNLWVLFKPSLMLYKERQKELELLGLINLLKGSFIASDTTLSIASSQLDFYGPLTNPLLELSLKTRKDGYLIFINVSGSADNPILQFDSEPPLAPNDILALLAFGSKTDSLIAAATGTSRFTSMLSNLFIKDLIANFGLKLDRVSLITSGNQIGFEIGKKISNKVTIIYKNDTISTLVIQYLINNSLESDIVVGPEKSGLHLYYRKVK